MSGCHEPKIKLKTYTGEGFLLYCPDDLLASQETRVEDFQIHTLKRNKEVVLNFYVGNQPKFPSEDFSGIVEQKTTIHGIATRSITRVLDGGRQDREVLFDLSSANAWPQYLHFSYRSLSPELAQTADAIIESVQKNTSPATSQ